MTFSLIPFLSFLLTIVLEYLLTLINFKVSNRPKTSCKLWRHQETRWKREIKGFPRVVVLYLLLQLIASRTRKTIQRNLVVNVLWRERNRSSGAVPGTGSEWCHQYANIHSKPMFQFSQPRPATTGNWIESFSICVERRSEIKVWKRYVSLLQQISECMKFRLLFLAVSETVVPRETSGSSSSEIEKRDTIKSRGARQRICNFFLSSSHS